MLKDRVMRKKRLPYSERSDIEKIKSNWTKVCVLYNRDEWSSAILRAATASEIATNLAIREELQVKRNLEAEFVNGLLKWANGIQGKFNRLLLPVTKGTTVYSKFKKIRNEITEINNERNSVIHNGQFKKRATAKKITLDAQKVIEVLVNAYYKDFRLNGPEEQ
jgi:hypothetical protein